jgi:anti-anti-sigma factor
VPVSWDIASTKTFPRSAASNLAAPDGLAQPVRLALRRFGKTLRVTDHARTGASRELTVDSVVRATSIDIALAGELDMAAAFRLEYELEALLATRGIDTVVLDLGDVRFLDSAGLGALLSISDQARRQGLDFRVGRMSEPVQRVLDATATRSALDEVENM